MALEPHWIPDEGVLEVKDSLGVVVCLGTLVKHRKLLVVVDLVEGRVVSLLVFFLEALLKFNDSLDFITVLLVQLEVPQGIKQLAVAFHVLFVLGNSFLHGLTCQSTQLLVLELDLGGNVAVGFDGEKREVFEADFIGDLELAFFAQVLDVIHEDLQDLLGNVSRKHV